MPELPELSEARLKVKALRSFVRQVDVALARAEEALEREAESRKSQHPQPKEAQGNEHDDRTLAAA